MELHDVSYGIKYVAGSFPKTIKQSNDPPLSRGYTLGSGEESLELIELMAKCTQIVCFVRKKNREICTTEEGLQAISATIDGHEKLITEDSLRRHLNSKKTAWDQFSSNIATTLICLATSRRFNFSKFIFEAMVKNLDSPYQFLLYPKFIQRLLIKQQRLLLPHTRSYPTPTLTSKLFSNMRRTFKGYSGVVTPLFEKPIQPTHEAEETASMPHDSPLHDVHSHGSVKGSVQQHDLKVLVTKLNDKIDGLEKDLQQTKKTYSTALTKLVLRVKKLEYKLKAGKARRKAKIVLSDDKEIAKDSSKKGRKISPIDEDPMIYLVQDEVSTASPPEKVKKITQVQLSMDEELARKMEEEERIRFNAEQEAKALQEEEERLNLEAARELQRQLD
ncbi:hypothetical protein Tco_0432178 [Tanacetum coccineum]